MDSLKKLFRTALAVSALLLAMTAAVSADTALVRANGGLNFRTGPGTNHSIICTIPNGTVITVNGAENGWVKATYNGADGFVSGQYVTIRKEVSANRSGGGAERTASQTKGEEIAEFAKQYVGTRYRYGGTSPETGFDCSGFVWYVYRQFGYTMNRVARDQTKNGVEVSFDDLQPGDVLVFSNSSEYYGHSGIYLGDGYFIHSVQTGTPVSITSLWGTNYGGRLRVARRIVQ